MTYPNSITLSKDGDKWSALMGKNLQEGFAGFGDTKADALRDLASQITVPPLDIDDELDAALSWAYLETKCEGCSADITKTEHSPICKVQARITASRGASGRVCMVNPHPSSHSA